MYKTAEIFKTFKSNLTKVKLIKMLVKVWNFLLKNKTLFLKTEPETLIKSQDSFIHCL